MARRRLGCLTAGGIGAALAVWLSIGLFTLVRGATLFSPGALSATAGSAALGGVLAHSELGGRCDACHTAPWSRQVMADRCLECHTDVGTEIQTGGGLHSAMLGRGTPAGGGVECRPCHTEHRGPNGNLTLVDAANFPHDSTGFSLAAHRQTSIAQPVTCSDCHGGDIMRFDPAACGACHVRLDNAYMATHSQAFGQACLECHDGVDRYGAGFDHNRTAFRLEAKHVQVACRECHAGARAPEDFRNTPHACEGCHDEPVFHATLFPTGCDSCHTAGGWAPARYDRPHRFPVDHEDAQVCRDCHDDLRTYTCAGCHPDREIAGQHLEEGIRDFSNCMECHPNGQKEEEGGRGGGGAARAAVGSAGGTIDGSHVMRHASCVIRHLSP